MARGTLEQAKEAYELARRIIGEGFPAPAHLFLSGCAAPSIPPKSRRRHLLPRDAILGMINELDGTPREVLLEESRVDLFEPLSRADLQALNTRRPEHLSFNTEETGIDIR